MSVSLGMPQVKKAGTPDDGQQQTLPSRPGDAGPSLIDRFGRVATDMRLSLIDKCNLRCTYCMPADGLAWLPKELLMSAGEITRLVRIAVEHLGVRELRLTGGEPLVRADLVDIIRGIRANHADLPISLTTNALGLDKKASALKEAGLTRINVSLDSLCPETFAQLTRRDNLKRVLAGVDGAAAAGLGPIKINAVLMRGINDAEAPDLVSWATRNGHELRFIEQMPLDADHGWTRKNMVTAAEVKERLSGRFDLRPDPRDRDGAPAERWEVRDPYDGALLGVIGIIASVTEPFCADCKRTRITAEGKVRSCLFSHEETDLMELLRSDASDVDVADRWRAAMWAKPAAHGMDHVGLDAPDFVQPERSMSAIGG
ncbi:GTP 3',8-cyclase MoaA [Arthrobacter monumenti]